VLFICPTPDAHRVDGLLHPLLYAGGVARNANFYFIVLTLAGPRHEIEQALPVLIRFGRFRGFTTYAEITRDHDVQRRAFRLVRVDLDHTRNRHVIVDIFVRPTGEAREEVSVKLTPIYRAVASP
jgi:hypothetical protein